MELVVRRWSVLVSGPMPDWPRFFSHMVLIAGSTRVFGLGPIYHEHHCLPTDLNGASYFCLGFWFPRPLAWHFCSTGINGPSYVNSQSSDGHSNSQSFVRSQTEILLRNLNLWSRLFRDWRNTNISRTNSHFRMSIPPFSFRIDCMIWKYWYYFNLAQVYFDM
jgi:hypothetical protein